MLSIDEFNDAASAHTRRMMIAFGVSTAGMLAIFGLGAFFRSMIYGFLAAHWGVPVAETFFVVGCVVAMGVLLGGTWLGYRHGKRDQRLLCPHCGAFIVESQRVIVATRNCVQCGRRVLAEPV